MPEKKATSWVHKPTMVSSSDGTNTKKSDRNSSKIVKCQIQGRIVGYSLLY